MKRILFIILLFTPFCFFAQQEIEVSEDFTTIMFFPEAIEGGPIIGNNQEYIVEENTSRTNIGKRTLKIKYVKIDKVEKNTNLTVVTVDGNIYEFILKYAKIPKNKNHYIKLDDAVTNLLNDGVTYRKKTKKQVIDQPVSRYTEDIRTKETKSDNTIVESSDLYGTDKLSHIEKYCQKTQYVRKKIFKTFDKSSNIKLTLKQISFDHDELYFHLLLENRGGQSYDVDFINSKIGTSYKGNNTSQTIPLTPIYIYEKPTRVAGNSEAHFIMVFEKFTINEKKELQIDLAEKEGERDLLLRIKNDLIIQPVKL